MKGVLKKIKPLHPELVPPRDAVVIGQTPDGKTLYREVVKRSRAVPAFTELQCPVCQGEPAEDLCGRCGGKGIVAGPRLYRKNPVTGENLVPVNKPEPYDQVQVYFLESQGNGNVGKVFYTPPSAEEIAEAQRQRKIAEMQTKFAEVLVDQGYTPDKILEALQGRSEPSVPDLQEEYPLDLGGGWWQLSDGSKIKHKKSDYALVEEAERAVSEQHRAEFASLQQQVKEAASIAPEF